MALLWTSGSLALSQLVCHLRPVPAFASCLQHAFRPAAPFRRCCCMHCAWPIICENICHLLLNDMCCILVAVCRGKETTTADWFNCIVHKGPVYKRQCVDKTSLSPGISAYFCVDLCRCTRDGRAGIDCSPGQHPVTAVSGRRR